MNLISQVRNLIHEVSRLKELSTPPTSIRPKDMSEVVLDFERYLGLTIDLEEFSTYIFVQIHTHTHDNTDTLTPYQNTQTTLSL